MSAAQNGCTSATSSTIPWTFAGVIVSTVPISSPVAGLKDSSAGLGFALEPFADDPADSLPFGLDFRLEPAFRLLLVLLELLASITCVLSSLALGPGDSTRDPRDGSGLPPRPLPPSLSPAEPGRN